MYIHKYIPIGTSKHQYDAEQLKDDVSFMQTRVS